MPVSKQIFCEEIFVLYIVVQNVKLKELLQTYNNAYHALNMLEASV